MSKVITFLERFPFILVFGLAQLLIASWWMVKNLFEDNLVEPSWIFNLNSKLFKQSIFQIFSVRQSYIIKECIFFKNCLIENRSFLNQFFQEIFKRCFVYVLNLFFRNFQSYNPVYVMECFLNFLSKLLSCILFKHSVFHQLPLQSPILWPGIPFSNYIAK